MEGGIDADAPLDHASIQISPNQNSYEVHACLDNDIEILATGSLEQLLFHLPEMKDFHSKRSGDKFILQLSGNLRGSAWFTKTTVARFLHIVGAPELLKTVNSIEDEISQLEDARRFHLSLYTQGHQDHSGSGETDGGNSNDMAQTLKPGIRTMSSDGTKNELLRAMDLRLMALREELVAAFDRAAGAACSPEQITDLVKFAEHFGAIDLRNSLFKYFALSQMSQAVGPQEEQSTLSHDSRNDSGKMTDVLAEVCTPVNTVKPVKYGVSPAKVAEVERQSSTENEESSDSGDEDLSLTERSRSLIRSASPRRSASPMRRIQIGRSGSRRATALTIKSLSYFPSRENVASNRDAARDSSEEEESDQPPKKPENNVRKMSVQDAINLFERKQRDQNSDLHKSRSLADVSANANKSVLRRWSAGMGDSSSQSLPENAADGDVQLTPKTIVVEASQKNSMEVKPESDLITGSSNFVKTAEVDAPLEIGVRRASYPTDDNADIVVSQAEETHNRVTASAEWNRQKEAELNQMLMKMMASKPVRYRNMAGKNSRSQEFSGEPRGGFYDHYKEKRDEKLRGENAGKRAEKESEFKAMQEILDQRKAEMASKPVGIAGKKESLGKPQKSQKNSSPSVQPKKESLKPAISRKASPKASPLPATRKSWPSAPSTRTTGTTPTKTPYGIAPTKTPNGVSSTGTTPTRRKSQPSPSPTRPTPKVEKPQEQQKSVKGTKTGTKHSLKGLEEKKQQAMTRSSKTTKSKVLLASGDDSSTKPSFYGKVTKKSSVVPLESKPFLRKGTGIGPGVGAVVKSKASQSDESLRNSGNMIEAQEDVINGISESVNQKQEVDKIPQVSDGTDLEAEALIYSYQKCGNTASSEQFVDEGDDSFKNTLEFSEEIQADEESGISSIAWVETEDRQELPVSCDNGPTQIATPSNFASVVALSSPRVRQSLSQMLQEDSGEPEIIEWGNAENPPAMVYQKDAPKGLKRLLKFARKSRGEANATGWSSPSIFSEGEEDAEEPKAVSKRNADILLRKAAIQAKGFGQQKTSLGESYDARNLAAQELMSVQSNISKFAAQNSSHKLQVEHNSVAANPTKATRSFFSLSTFRSSKSNETKLR